MSWRQREIEGSLNTIVRAASVAKKIDLDPNSTQEQEIKSQDFVKQSIFNAMRKINYWIALAAERQNMLREYRYLIKEMFLFIEHDRILRAHATEVRDLMRRADRLEKDVIESERVEYATRRYNEENK